MKITELTHGEKFKQITSRATTELDRSGGLSHAFPSNDLENGVKPPKTKAAKPVKLLMRVKGWQNAKVRDNVLSWKPKDPANKVRIEKNIGRGSDKYWIIFGGGKYITQRSFNRLNDARTHCDQQFQKFCDGESIDVGNAAVLGTDQE
jgi:hypothetical protein